VVLLIVQISGGSGAMPSRLDGIALAFSLRLAAQEGRVLTGDRL